MKNYRKFQLRNVRKMIKSLKNEILTYYKGNCNLINRYKTLFEFSQKIEHDNKILRIVIYVESAFLLVESLIVFVVCHAL